MLFIYLDLYLQSQIYNNASIVCFNLELHGYFDKPSSQTLQTILNRGFFLWLWSLNSGLRACKAGIPPLKLCLQSILIWLFWGWGSRMICQDWLQTLFLLISASQVARITGVSHQCLASK
jgi:hypothetical protein